MAQTFSTTPAVKPPQPQPLLPLKQDLQNFIEATEPRVLGLTRRLIDEKQPAAAAEVLGTGLALLARLRATVAGIR